MLVLSLMGIGQYNQVQPRFAMYVLPQFPQCVRRPIDGTALLLEGERDTELLSGGKLRNIM